MVKKKFCPFVHYKWSWFDWPGPKEKCSLLYESRLVKSLDWEDAYWCCRDDIEYIDKYECRFNDRNSARSICLFLILMLVLSVAVAVVTYFCCYRMWVFPLIVLEIFVLVLVGIILRVIYYRGVDFDLHHADNRIESLVQVWPDIVDVVYDDIDNSSTDLPPEPEKVPVPDFLNLNIMKPVDKQLPNLKLPSNGVPEKDEDKIIADLIDGLKLGTSEEEPMVDKENPADLEAIVSEITREIEALDALLKRGS